MKTILKAAGAFIASLIIIICFAYNPKLNNQSEMVIVIAAALSLLTTVYFFIKLSGNEHLISSATYLKTIKQALVLVVISAMVYFAWVSIFTFSVNEMPDNLRYVKGFLLTDSAKVKTDMNDEQLFLHFSDGQPSQMGETWKGWTILINQIGIAICYFVFTICLSVFSIHAFFKNEIYSINNFKDKINLLNRTIFENSESQLDLGSLLGTKHKLDSENIVGEHNNAIFYQANKLVNDDLRRQIIDAVEGEKYVSVKEMQKILKSILKRTILYVGCECERQAFIGVDAEFNSLKQALKSEYMELSRVIKPTVKNLMVDWDKKRPSVLFISCHGSINGLFLKNDKSLCQEYNNIDFLSFFKPKILFIECVILSACESLSLGEMIVDYCRNVVCINRRIDIKTATVFCSIFMEFLNDHSLQNTDVYKNAFDFAKSYVKFEGLQDAFAFKFLKAEVINN